MQNWRSRMPKGMHLKSDGFASSLFEPKGRLTLRNYCAEKSIPYADLSLPVALETFWAYGMDFQRRAVPSLDLRTVEKLEQSGAGFSLTLSDGESVNAQRVVIATGISYFEYLPQELRSLPSTHCSHSADNDDLSKFAGRRILVIGRGASATDVAALLVDHGAAVEIVSRAPIIFHDGPGAKPPSLWWRIRNPNFGLGPNRRSAAYTLFPKLFRLLPAHLRHRIVKNHLGPAAVWYIREKMESRVPMRSGYALKSAEVRGEVVKLQFIHEDDGGILEAEADHVIAGTGYRVDLARLPFLNDALRSKLLLDGTSPALSAHFESSVPGLYFVGLASAATFGPLTRFAHGAGFTARNLSAHLRRRQPRPTVAGLANAHT